MGTSALSSDLSCSCPVPRVFPACLLRTGTHREAVGSLLWPGTLVMGSGLVFRKKAGYWGFLWPPPGSRGSEEAKW